MKIEHLIEALKEYNPLADITLTTSEDITLSYICKDSNGNPLNKQSTMQVFIEGRDLCPLCAHEYIDKDVKMCSFYNKPCELIGECYQFEEFYEQE